MKHQYQSFTRIGRQLHSLKRQVYADWTSVSFPLCQRSSLIWRKVTNRISGAASSISGGAIFIYSCSGQLSSFEIDLISKELNCPEHEYMNMTASLIELAALLNTMTNTYVVIFLSASIFGRGYYFRYQNFEFTDLNVLLNFIVHSEISKVLAPVLSSSSR